MSAALSVLLLEDDPSSIRLFTRKVQSAPVEIAVKDVRNKETFLRALEANQFDCIVIDYTLPDINGIEALRIVNEMLPGTPSIIYTGSVGEEKAVECMKEGAMEFLLKTNSIRLVPAILSVVNQKRDHEARVRAEEAQKKSEERFRALAETSTAAIFIFQGERLTYINPISEKITGYTHDELMGLNVLDIVHPDFKNEMRERGLARQRGEDVPARYEFKIIDKNGRERWLDFAVTSIPYEGASAGLGIAFDVTERKKIEEQLQDSEQRYRTMFEANPHPMWVYDIDTNKFLTVNDAAIHRYGYSKKEFLSMTIKDIRPQDDIPDLEKHLKKRKQTGGLDEAGIWRHKNKNGEIMEVEVMTHTMDFDGHHAKMVLATEIKKQKLAKKKKNNF
jgi:PAS domain S-box-containing protein